MNRIRFLSLFFSFLSIFYFSSLGYAAFNNDPNTPDTEWFFPIDRSALFDPVLTQLDRSTQEQEIVVNAGQDPFGSLFDIYGFIPNDDPLPGWDPNTVYHLQQPFTKSISRTPAIGDIDGDGVHDVVFGIYNSLFVFDEDADFKWLIGEEVFDSPMTDPVLGDLDKDGNKEIIVSESGYIFIFEGNGRFYKPDQWHLNLGRMVAQSPAVSDVDGNGRSEIATCGVQGPSGFPSQVTLFKEDASVFWGPEGRWPAEIPYADDGGTRLADLNEDGWLDVIAYAYDENLDRNYFYVFNRFGKLFPGQWPVTLDGLGKNTGIVIGELDRTFPGLEILVGFSESATLYAFHFDTTALTGWPFNGKSSEDFSFAPVIGDLNGDGKQDVVIVSEDTDQGGEVYILNETGRPQFGTPAELSGRRQPTAQPAIGDPDQDSKTEMILSLMSPGGNISHYLTMWEFGLGETGVIQWAMNGGNSSDHTNSFGRVFSVGEGEPYATISAALEEAAAGDTILVHRGTYLENVKLKAGVNLIGGSANRVIIKSPNSLPAVEMESFSVLRNVSAVNPLGAAVKVLAENYSVSVRNVIARDSIVGMEVASGSNAQIANMTAYNNTIGIDVKSSGDAKVLNSIFTKNSNVALQAQTPGFVDVEYSDIYLDRVGANVNLGQGIIHLDPEFIDPRADNFFYDEKSPCRNQGKLGYPFYEEVQQPDNTVIDLGAFGGTKESSENVGHFSMQTREKLE